MANQDWLQQQLHNAQPYIADDGFSDQVLARLPPQRHRRASQSQLTLLLATAIGAAIAAFGLFVANDSAQLMQAWAQWLHEMAISNSSANSLSVTWLVAWCLAAMTSAYTLLRLR